jgi:hypothetical protein
MNYRRPRWAWLFFFQLALIVTASVLATTGHFPVAIFQRWPLDKLGHLFIYGGLSFLGVAFFGPGRSLQLTIGLLAAATLEEISQRFFPRRTFDLADMAMNLIGISVFGAAAVLGLGRKSRAARQAAPERALLEPRETHATTEPAIDTALHRQLSEEDDLRREVARAHRTLVFERAAINPIKPSLEPFSWGLIAFIVALLSALLFRCVRAL